jgi:hypothetical protein
MAGDTQVPSGTPFDPLPQLFVYEWTPTDGLLTILGTCFFGPLVAGGSFYRVAHRTEAGWEEVGECDLEIIDISIFQGVLVDTLEQNYNARVTAKGRVPTAPEGREHLLIGMAHPDGMWEWDGRFWVRAGAP